MELIKIGMLVDGFNTDKWIPAVIKYGFESIALNYQKNTGNMDFTELSKKLKDRLDEHNIKISCISIYANPLRDDNIIAEWEKCIDHAPLFGADVVSGFTGRLNDKSVPENMPRFKEVFDPLARRAADKGVKLTFENCYMGDDWYRGTYNIANSPLAWEMMFNEVPAENIGIEWEPAHQMSQLRDPYMNLKKWAKKIFHVHGKDANLDWDIIKEYGIGGPKGYCRDRMPGYGDTDWKKICSILYSSGYTGTIDIEGFHDPFFKNNLEITGQVAALKYLKDCRGGDCIA